jgi:tripartite ATP-independent transporter DctP family solute receptor
MIKKTIRLGAALAALFMMSALSGAAVAADYPTMTIKFGDIVTHNFGYYHGMVAFKKAIEEKTGGRIKVDIFTDGALGTTRDVIDGVRLGTIQMSSAANANTQSLAPEHGIFDLPYLFTSRAAWRKVAYGPLGEQIGATIQPQGLKFLGWVNGGGRGIMSKKPITSPADLVGLKVRVLPDPLMLDIIKSMGGQPVAIDPGAIYTGLQQGVVNAVDCNVEIAASYSLAEVAKYYTETQDMMPPGEVLANLAWWNGLNKDTQTLIATLITTVYRPASDAFFADIDPTASVAEQTKQAHIITDKGVIMVKPDLAAFRKATRPVFDKYKAKFGAELVDKVIKAAGE